MHSEWLNSKSPDILFVWYEWFQTAVNFALLCENFPSIMAIARNVVRRALLYGMRVMTDLHGEICSV